MTASDQIRTASLLTVGGRTPAYIEWEASSVPVPVRTLLFNLSGIKI